MNLTTFVVITVLTVAFVIYMAKRTLNILEQEGQSLPKTVLHLNGLRMSTMFISFLGTIAGAISLVVLFLQHSEISQEAKVLSYIVAIAFATLFSFQLSSTLVASEQTLGEKLEVPEKKIFAVVLVVILSALDYYSMSIGGNAFAQSIKNKKIQESKESNSAIKSAIKTDSELLQSKIDKVEKIDKLLEDPENIQVVSNEKITHYENRVQKWEAKLKSAKSAKDKAAYSRYIAINKQNIQEELAKQRGLKIEDLKLEKEALNKEVNKLRVDVVSNAKYIDKKNNKAESQARAQADDTSVTISSIALGIVLFNISLGFVSGRLNSNETIAEALESTIGEGEAKEIRKVEKSKKELQEDYIAKAMKSYATEKRYIAQDGFVRMHKLKFPRDTIVEKAKTLAAKEGIKLEIGNTTAQRILDTHKQSRWLEEYIISQTPEEKAA